ncbi:hypothetical protein [Trinickia symbiotica]|nr:hypothetical protein [Trinickia symbiotica]
MRHGKRIFRRDEIDGFFDRCTRAFCRPGDRLDGVLDKERDAGRPIVGLG